MENTTYDSPTRFGYEILRDHVLPSILGKHEDEILYWAGKEVARKFPIFGIDELPEFFQEAGWGPLHLEKTLKDEAFYSLKNDFATNAQNRSCQLEAGFIAQQYQKFSGLLTECYGEFNAKDGLIHFQVKWDLKTKVEA
ncbi:YslB family protein [Sporosarcina sp. FSL K6-1540]|uniref:YslB family protein n=1 Tax=Sporosarcina TaxID=1569 RepID=UPI0030D43344